MINQIDFTLLDDKDLSRDWIIEGWLAKGDLAVLAGEPYCGKSFLAMYLALGIVHGESWITKMHVPKPRRILYIDEDNNRSSIELRLQTIPRRRDRKPSEWSGLMPYLYSNGLTLKKCKTGHGMLEDRFYPELIIIDSLYCFAGADLNKQEDVGVIRSEFRAMQAANGDCSILVLHHMRKRQEHRKGKKTTEDMLGSTFINAMADTVWMLTLDGNTHCVSNEKLRIDPEAGKRHSEVRFGIDDHVVKMIE